MMMQIPKVPFNESRMRAHEFKILKRVVRDLERHRHFLSHRLSYLSSCLLVRQLAS